MIKRLNWLLVAIVVFGFLLRIYNFDLWFQYSHDQDLLGWIVRDVIENMHPRLIGQETSQTGVFIGPLFYYSVIPFYLLFNWSPIGGVFWVALLGAFGVWSFWYVFKKIHSNTAGYAAALIYATSYSVIFTDREVVPTMPVIIWTIWFLYVLNEILHNRQKVAWPLAGILVGLIWHLNLGLAVICPVLFVAWVLSRKRLQIKPLIAGVFVSVCLLAPLVLFEFRHGGTQLEAILSSGAESSVSVTDKFDRVLQLLGKNIYRLYFADIVPFPHLYTIFLALGGLFFITFKRIIPLKLSVLLWLWLGLYLLFFSVNSINVSEYYLNGLNIIWILIPVMIASFLYHQKYNYKAFGGILMCVLVAINIIRVLQHQSNKSGYVERTAIINEIKRDADLRGYDCVSLSFITSPGNELGYRYITWLAQLKTKPVTNDIPVYTIVFPLRFVDRVDQTYGALGLIYPEYQRYNDQQIAESCQGDDFNTTYPLFGYTE